MESLQDKYKEYSLIALVLLALVFYLIFPQSRVFLIITCVYGAFPILKEAVLDLWHQKKVTIVVFNAIALVASFVTFEFLSTAFIILMLTFARLLDGFTQGRANKAIEEILKLKPRTATREVNGLTEEVAVELVKVGDLVIVNTGARIPVDGKVVYGKAHINEAPLTGESRLVEKVVGDDVSSSTLNESGVIKIQATRVGKDSTVEQIAALVRSATKNKSKTEKLADRFAQIFLPIVALSGLAAYFITGKIETVVALFLVACADDMAVAIPLAITAALGKAAQRGVIIKGGEYIDVLRKMNTLVMDKTGTLTYGTLKIEHAIIEPRYSESDFWAFVAGAEKFSEHPVGKAIYRQAAKDSAMIPDPETFEVKKGSGLVANVRGQVVAIGNLKLLQELSYQLPPDILNKFKSEQSEHEETTVLVYINSAYAGIITVADVSRPEAPEALRKLSELGVSRLIMFTGDNEQVAKRVSARLGVPEFVASMSPEDKMLQLEKLTSQGTVGMIGDGINDAPSLARADVGIAMGGGGTSVAVEAANVVLLTDDLNRLPEIVKLCKKTMGVINGDMAIWLLTNVFGFAMVFAGFFGPALAALYNFITDFFPLINSARLFRNGDRK